MKAKEYAERYYKTMAHWTPDLSPEEAERYAISEVLIGLATELATLTKTRGKSTFEAVISCFDEIERKWRAFTYLVPGWKADGFILFIQSRHPDLWTLYQIGKQEMRNYADRRG